jgi:hypothetical protein
MSNESPLEHILPCLEGVEETSNGSYQALCPAHDDHDPSLSVSAVVENGTQKVLISCWAGCERDQILKKLGLEWKDLFSSNESDRRSGRIVATYEYTSPSGKLLHQTVRYEPKRFLQRRPDGNGGWVWDIKEIEPILYRLPEVLKACLKGETIYVLEGEKDVDRAQEELGITATTCAMGAGKWRESYTHTLIGANVILVPHNDEAGRKHVLKVAQDLRPVAASVRILELPGLRENGDLTDWINAGGTTDEFEHFEPRLRYDLDQLEEMAEAFHEEGAPEGVPTSVLTAGRSSVRRDALAAPIREGERNVTLASVAGSLRDRGLDEGNIAVVLLEVNRLRCDPPLEATEVLRIARSVGRYAVGSPRYRSSPIRRVRRNAEEV